MRSLRWNLGRFAFACSVLLGVVSRVGLSGTETEGRLMAASPKKRERLEAGEPRHPWKENPYANTQRPPFEPGNEKALLHGARSERKLAPVAEQLEREIVKDAPWCARPAFAAAVSAWAAAEAVCLAYRNWFFEQGLRDEEDQPATGLVAWDRAEARAAKLRARLSLDPSALASLLTKLVSVESSGGQRASAEREAIEAEIAQLDEEIAEAMQKRELGQ
jgi:hypothetical protein